MKKRILFLINTLSGGGAEKVLVDTVNNMNPDKFDVTLCTLSDIGIYQNSLKDHVNYRSIDGIFKNKFIKKFFRFLVFKILPERYIYRLFIKKNYDVEIAFLEGKPTKILSYSNNPNKIAWVHLDMWNFYNGLELVYNSVEEHTSCYKKYKSIYCVSQSAKEGFKKRFGFDENVYVQYNPVDENAIVNLASEELSEIGIPSKLKLITIGRLVEAKGYERLLKVVNKLRNDGYDFVLWILGEGEKRAELEQYIDEKDLNEFVKLMGFQKNPYKFMSHADAFVCSSYSEGFSTVATEATILGIPTVTTDCSGMHELFGDSEYGIITENSENGIYDGLKKIMDSKDILGIYKTKALKRGKDFCIKKRIDEIENNLLQLIL